MLCQALFRPRRSRAWLWVSFLFPSVHADDCDFRGLCRPRLRGMNSTRLGCGTHFLGCRILFAKIVVRMFVPRAWRGTGLWLSSPLLSSVLVRCGHRPSASRCLEVWRRAPLFHREMFAGACTGSRPGLEFSLWGRFFVLFFGGDVFNNALSFPRELSPRLCFSGNLAVPWSPSALVAHSRPSGPRGPGAVCAAVAPGASPSLSTSRCGALALSPFLLLFSKNQVWVLPGFSDFSIFTFSILSTSTPSVLFPALCFLGIEFACFSVTLKVGAGAME